MSEDCEAELVQSVFVSADGSEGVYRAILGASTTEVADAEGGRNLGFSLCQLTKTPSTYIDVTG